MWEEHHFYTYLEAPRASLATYYSMQKLQQLLLGQAQSDLIKPAKNCDGKSTFNMLCLNKTYFEKEPHQTKGGIP